MRISRPNMTDVVFEAGDSIDTREGIAMFRKGGKIYKMLNYNQDVHDEKSGLDDKVVNSIVRLTKGTYHDTRANGLARAREVLVIEMKEIDNTNFFQMSNGGAARLIGWINAETDQERLKRIGRALVSGRDAGLTDPQGFYLTEGPDPVVFIDLHTNNGQSQAFDTAIAAVEARKAAL